MLCLLNNITFFVFGFSFAFTGEQVVFKGTRWCIEFTLTVSTKESNSNADAPLMLLANLSSWCVLAGVN